MEGTPRLYDTLVQVLSQHQNWVDRRHLKTLACMVAGLGPFCAQPSHVCAEHRASVDPLARECTGSRPCTRWSVDPASPRRVGRSSRVSGPGYVHALEHLLKLTDF
jgi:hypothetical protein